MKQTLPEIEAYMQSAIAPGLKITGYGNVTGGCINNGKRLNTNHGSYFLKYNDKRYMGMFDAEKKGLNLLRKEGTPHVPKVHLTGETSTGVIFIVMEWLDNGVRRNEFWQVFGKQLATLHRNTNDYFGLDHDNFIGSLPQINTPSSSWPKFFIESRLLPQIKMARDSRSIPPEVARDLESIFKLAEGIFPDEKPALLHGDLWSGNFTSNEMGLPAIFDPAVYYGHREMEIAFTKLFGGYNNEFYLNYNQEYPLEEGFEERADICNLYPLMVHVNLFGESYLFQVQQILKKFLR